MINAQLNLLKNKHILPADETAVWCSTGVLSGGGNGNGTAIFVGFRISCSPRNVIATVEYTDTVRKDCSSGMVNGIMM